MVNNLSVGDQIVYLPIDGCKITDKEAEYGFITGFSSDGNAAFCRFLRRGVLSIDSIVYDNPAKYFNNLRTKANGEAVPSSKLRKLEIVDQEIVDSVMKMLGYNEKDSNTVIA